MSIMASETCPLSCYAGENQTQTKKKFVTQNDRVSRYRVYSLNYRDSD